jgi:hypothetical protein
MPPASGYRFSQYAFQFWVRACVGALGAVIVIPLAPFVDMYKWYDAPGLAVGAAKITPDAVYEKL